MKRLKKILALALAMAMVVAMALPSFAAQPNAVEDGTNYSDETHSDNTWTGTKDNEISITGLATGDVVKFYRVLDYDQNASNKVDNPVEMTTGQNDWGAGSWKVVSPFNTGDNKITKDQFQAILTTGITAEMAGQIAKNATSTATHEVTVLAADNGVAKKTAPGAGLYVAIVEPANPGVMYNPIFVASDYYTTTGGDKSNTWAPVTNALSYAPKAMAKKSEITVKKEAAENAEAANETDEAKAVGVGDKVDFTVKTTIPEFADNYTSPLFVINDTLSTGLKLDQNSIKVYKATVSGDTWTKGEEITATKDNGGSSVTQFTIPTKTDTAYKIKFDKDYLLGLTEITPVIVEYSATVTETAVTNVNEENNTITVEYSHKPDVDDEGEGKKLRDKTHHYSFTIDGSIWGTSEYRTIESVKVGLDKNGNEITQTQQIANGKTVGALSGAEFKLYTDADCTTEYAKGAYATATATESGNKIVSDEKGYLKINGGTGISGLDAGIYYLKEEKAPEGYIKQQAATKIEIIPTYYDEFTFTDSDGLEVKTDDVLKSYIVKINDVQTAEYVLNYTYKDSKTQADANRVPNTDVAIEDDQNMKTTHNDVVIGNEGPIKETDTGTKKAAEEAGKIKNTQGVELPSTGGIGTTIFYVVGAILVIGAGVVLITKRRMEA